MRSLGLTLAVLALTVGAANTQASADEADDVMAALREYAKAFNARDTEAALTFYSENWRKDANAKEDLKENFAGGFFLGRYEGTEVEIDRTEVEVDGDTASVGPVNFTTAEGDTPYMIVMKRESDGQWRAVYSEWWVLADKTLNNNLLTARSLREQLLSDPHRPGYHFVVPEGIAVPFDPNGAIFWKGRYHLFYIFQDKRSGLRREHHWGHVSSTDLFHWRHHPTGLIDGMFSGNCFINKNGRPTMCYHQVGEGNAMAVALDDELNEWKKLGVITPQTQEGDKHHGKYRSWDPFGWVVGDTYYAISGGEHPGVAKSTTLDGDWKYTGDLFAHGVEGVSLTEDVSCADLFKLGGKDVLLGISHEIGCRYYIGEWKDEQFYPKSHAQMSWEDDSFFAPESLVDDKGRRIMWAWILDGPGFDLRMDYGWSGTMSLPRVLTLGDDGLLRMDVPKEIEGLRYAAVKKEDLNIASDAELLLDDVAGNSLELVLDMESAEASSFGVKVCVSPDGQEETVIYYDVAEGKLKVDTRNSGPEDSPKTVEAAPFKLKDGERLKLRVFVDKSVVEVFANGRQAVARRIYPSRTDSVGVRLFSVGGDTDIHSLEAYQMAPSNPF
jgi:beta-fructofuranosidase